VLSVVLRSYEIKAFIHNTVAKKTCFLDICSIYFYLFLYLSYIFGIQLGLLLACILYLVIYSDTKVVN